MSLSFEFNAPQFFNTSDDPDADKFFVSEHIKHITANARKSLGSPQGKNNDVAVDVKNNEEFSTDEIKLKVVDAEAENKDPCCDGSTVDSIKQKSSISRKVLNQIINQELQNNEEKLEKQELVAIDSEEQLIKGLECLNITRNTPGKRITKTPFKNKQKFDGIEIEKPIPKKHSMVTRLDSQINTPVINLRNRCVPISNKKLETSDGSNEDIPSLSRNVKSFGVKRKASPLSGKKKFVSLAERIQHFHFDTPDRFRTLPKYQIVPQNIKLRGTVPKTPVLSAKYRCRPVDFPDERKREELELEEMKKNRVKAYPLNEKILKGPVLNLKFPVEKKAATVPEPFKLTEMKRKEHPRSPVFIFKAHPLPATILNGPTGVPPKKAIKTTVPLTPNIKVPVRFSQIHGSAFKPSTPRQTTFSKTTKIEPFSFDQKIKEMRLKKEENIKKVLEEEKKAFNSFRAHPLPSYLGKEIFNQSGTPLKSDRKGIFLNIPHGSKKETAGKNSTETLFKARPASVVHQKPFIPVLTKHASALPDEFVLNTEKRAAERQKFDEKMKKKEEIQAQVLQQRKEEEERLEQQLKLEHRKLTEFKAKPVPKYKPFEVLSADPSNLTLPVTPKFMSNK